MSVLILEKREKINQNSILSSNIEFTNFRAYAKSWYRRSA